MSQESNRMLLGQKLFSSVPLQIVGYNVVNLHKGVSYETY